MNLFRSGKERCRPNNFGAVELSYNAPCPAHFVSSAIINAYEIVPDIDAILQLLATLSEGANFYPHAGRLR